MLQRAQGPFVGLSESPVSGGEPLKITDVLNDAVFLVVGFFDQKAVVLDGSGVGIGLDGDGRPPEAKAAAALEALSGVPAKA